MEIFPAFHHPGSHQHRKAHVSSGAYYGVRPESFQHFKGLFYAVGYSGSGPDYLLGRFVFYPPGVHQFHRIAALRHYFLFYPLDVSYIQYLRLGLHFFEFVGDSKGRIYMASRSSACHNKSHVFTYNFDDFEIFIRIPMAPMNIIRALPP